jgi:hypothetical protein
MIFNSLREQHEYTLKQREQAEKAKAKEKQPEPKKTAPKVQQKDD